MPFSFEDWRAWQLCYAQKNQGLLSPYKVEQFELNWPGWGHKITKNVRLDGILSCGKKGLKPTDILKFYLHVFSYIFSNLPLKMLKRQFYYKTTHKRYNDKTKGFYQLKCKCKKKRKNVDTDFHSNYFLCIYVLNYERPLAVIQGVLELRPQKWHIIAIYYALVKSRVSQDIAALYMRSQHLFSN